MKSENSQEILKNEEFERAIKVEEIASPAQPPPASPQQVTGKYVRLPGPPPIIKPSEVVPKTPLPRTAKKRGNEVAPKSGSRQPELEDSEGFTGRRPIVDPFRVGEKVTMEVSYFSVVAGEMTVQVRPFVQVNGRKSYKFLGTAMSSSVFAMFYSVDDWFEAYLDYETMTPSSYALHVKETKQLRETRSVFDWTKNIATYWDKKIDSEKKVEEKKKEWSIPLYSQNIFTAVYYLRVFQLRPGKKISFRVAHEGENLVLTADVLRREKLKTAVGELDTVVLKPKIELDGNFRPVGDIYLWLTDDDRKLMVRFESKIKIGTIVAAVKSIDKGN